MSSKAIKGIQIEIGASTQKLTKALEDVNKKTRDVQSELRQVERLLKLDPSNTTLLAQKQKLLADAVDNSREKLDRLRAAQSQVEEQFRRGEIGEEQYRAFQRELIRAEQELNRFEDDLRRANDRLRQFGEGMQDAGKKMTAAGKNLSTKVTAPIVGMGAAIVKTGMDFEEAMSRVAAISGATGGELEKLEQQAKDLGATTIFSASEAASAQEFLAMAGFKVNDILSAMPGLLDLAAAGALELGNAADITSNIMSGFGIEASKTGHIADVLAKASSNANTNVAQLGEAMKPLAPVANTLGWSMEEATAAVMALSDAGIQGEQAGTAFATSLGRLAKPTGKMAKVINELGISFFDASGNMKSMPEVIAEVERATEGMTAQQKSATLTILFGAEAYKHWAILLDRGSEALGEMTEGLVSADGAAAQMAKTMSENTKGDIKTLLSALEGLAIQLSETLLPIISSAVNKLTEWTRKFAELSPASQKVILVIAGLAAAIGPLLLVFGPLISTIGTLITGLGAMSTAMAGGATLIAGLTAGFPALGAAIAVITGPIGIAVAAIAGLVAAGVLLYKNWDEVKAKAEEIWNKIKDFFSKTLEKIKQTFENVWNGIKDFFAGWGKDLILVVAGPAGWAVLLGKRITENWDLIKNATNRVWGNIKTAITQPIESARQTIMSIIQRIKDAFANLRITIPKPKLPHIEVDWRSVGIGDARINIPKFSLNWYKTGGIFDRPSIIGVGEAGTEAVIPLDKMPGLIADALRDAMGGGQVAMAGGITVQNMYVRNDQDIKLVARELYNLQQQNARGRGLR